LINNIFKKAMPDCGPKGLSHAVERKTTVPPTVQTDGKGCQRRKVKEKATSRLL